MIDLFWTLFEKLFVVAIRSRAKAMRKSLLSSLGHRNSPDLTRSRWDLGLLAKMNLTGHEKKHS